MLLGTYGRRRRHSDPGKYRPTPARVGPLHVTPPTNFRGAAAPNLSQTVDPLLEFDEYGTELHKDARVWKVYVKETDKYDADLVKGWNDSTDVILIFAALFSAISTAFLIESSKMLQEDSAGISAQALLSISRTLGSIANGTQSVGFLDPPLRTSVGYVPSRVAVCVNTLWYLSLSLSLATSFIAILSKDWCRSFMASRTGHPYSQTLRRQQKWDMLERWKMAELLAVLPSMIHMALLLFSVGLCIQLWDKHTVVALPVICTSVIAFGFYAWSSAAATYLDYFPYPTIISQLCRTEIVQRGAHITFQFVYQCMFQLAPQLVDQLAENFRLLLLWLRYVSVRIFENLLFVLALVPAVIDALLEPHLEGWRRRHTSNISLPRRLVTPLYQLVYYMFWRPANVVSGWFDRAFERWYYARWIAEMRLSKPEWLFEWTKLEYPSQVDSSSPWQSNITSMAISWLIRNCEVPQSVDVALQSIAGASKGLPRGPLQDCLAAVEIAKRLAASKLYRSSNTEIVVSLYARALSFLDSSVGQGSSATQSHTGDSLEVMIWDLQTQIESSVAALMTDGQFQPSPHNLAALRIGSTVASQCLRVMRGDTSGVYEMFNVIYRLMNRHLSKEDSLHPSALLSLVNATLLLSLFCKDPRYILPPPAFCTQLLEGQKYIEMPKLRAALVACALMQHWLGRYHRLLQWSSGTIYRAPAEALPALIEIQSSSKESSKIMAQFGLEELLCAPEDYSLGDGGLDVSQARESRPAIAMNSAAGSLSTGTTGDNISRCIQALHTMYKLIPYGTPYKGTYEFVLAVICRHPPSRAQCWQIVPKLEFPGLSTGLGYNLEIYSIVDSFVQELQASDETMRFFAIGQLWLFFALCLWEPPSVMGQEKLRSLLEKYVVVGLQGYEARYEHLGDLAEQLWDNSGQKIAGFLGLYAYRLMECILQSRNCPIPEHIHNTLRYTPQRRRGIQSLLNWNRLSDAVERMRRVEPTVELPGPTGSHPSPVDGSGVANDAHEPQTDNGQTDHQVGSAVEGDPPNISGPGSTHGEVQATRKGDMSERRVLDQGGVVCEIVEEYPEASGQEDGRLGQVCPQEGRGGVLGGSSTDFEDRKGQASRENLEGKSPEVNGGVGAGAGAGAGIVDDHVVIDIPKEVQGEC